MLASMRTRPAVVVRDAEGLRRLPDRALARLDLGTGVLPLCIVRLRGEIRGVPDSCPHLGAPLSAGEFHGTAVTCPGHGRRYDMVTGRPVGVTGEPTAAYVVAVDHDEVQLRAAQPQRRRFGWWQRDRRKTRDGSATR